MSTSNILVVDDEAAIRSLIDEILSEEGYRVSTAGDASEARRKYSATPPDLVLLDVWMPDTDGISLLREWSDDQGLDCPVVIMSGHGTVETAVEATRHGAADFVEKPLSITKLLRTVEKALDSRGTDGTPKSIQLQPEMSTVLGKSPAISALRNEIESAAALQTSALLIGEPGSGRETAARHLHRLSDRSDQVFLAIDPAHLPEENAPTILLGSDTESGLFERASGGILYVGDVHEWSSTAQRILLGVLESGRVTRVGRAHDVAVDIRFIGSTSPAAWSEREKGPLRQEISDLLSVSRIQVPALREYPEDVPELLRIFVDQHIDADGVAFRRFDVAAQNRLRNYPWPGNLQELKGLVRHMLSNKGPEEIGLAELEQSLDRQTDQEQSLLKKDLLSLPLREAREQFERAYLTEQLLLCGGKVGQLAKRVGMERTHLYRKLRALGIDFRRTGGSD